MSKANREEEKEEELRANREEEELRANREEEELRANREEEEKGRDKERERETYLKEHNAGDAVASRAGAEGHLRRGTVLCSRAQPE